MATNLRKYKYSGPASTRPSNSSDQSVSKSPGEKTPPPADTGEMEIASLKSEILLSLKADISAVIKSELKNALAEDFDFLKSELKAVKSEIINNTAALKSDIDQMTANIREVEGGLSTWSDEVATLQNTVSDMKIEMAKLQDKCEDMEGRMRRSNIRIIGIPETPDSCATATVSKMLTEVLQLDKEPLVDRSHRTPGPRRSAGKPRAIVAKLHYYQDCAEVLRRARTRGPLRFKGELLTIFPDYTPGVAKARAAFTEVRKLLRDRQGVRYGIMFPARLRITYKGEAAEFTETSKAMTYVKASIIPGMEAGQCL